MMTHSGGGNIVWQRGGLLGRGSFGSVFSCIDVNTSHFMAVKEFDVPQVLHPGATASASQLQRYRKSSLKRQHKCKSMDLEVNMLANLRHVNVVALLGSGMGLNASGREVFHILMEYVAGASLDTVIQQVGGPLNDRITRCYTRQMLSGLVFCHAHDVIHRDFKTANVLVSKEGVIKIADFGSAKRVIGKGMAPSVSYNFTPLYTAPEVFGASSYDAGVDIWSLGCVLVEMATGSKPWSEKGWDSEFRAMFVIAQANERPAIPDSGDLLFSGFANKCLTLIPSDRPSALTLASHPYIERATPPLPPWGDSEHVNSTKRAGGAFVGGGDRESRGDLGDRASLSTGDLNLDNGDGTCLSLCRKRGVRTSPRTMGNVATFWGRQRRVHEKRMPVGGAARVVSDYASADSDVDFIPFEMSRTNHRDSARSVLADDSATWARTPDDSSTPMPGGAADWEKHDGDARDDQGARDSSTSVVLRLSLIAFRASTGGVGLASRTVPLRVHKDRRFTI
jgi:serine/threonine protein kinase